MIICPASGCRYFTNINCACVRMLSSELARCQARVDVARATRIAPCVAPDVHDMCGLRAGACDCARALDGRKRCWRRATGMCMGEASPPHLAAEAPATLVRGAYLCGHRPHAGRAGCALAPRVLGSDDLGTGPTRYYYEASAVFGMPQKFSREVVIFSVSDASLCVGQSTRARPFGKKLCATNIQGC